MTATRTTGDFIFDLVAKGAPAGTGKPGKGSKGGGKGKLALGDKPGTTEWVKVRTDANLDGESTEEVKETERPKKKKKAPKDEGHEADEEATSRAPKKKDAGAGQDQKSKKAKRGQEDDEGDAECDAEGGEAEEKKKPGSP